MARHLCSIALLALLIGACTDVGPTESGDAEAPGVLQHAESPEAAALSALPQGRLGLQDIFADLAQRVPGGFGGLYYDEEGRLALVLADPTRQAEARAALHQEPFIQARQDRAWGADFQLSSAEVRGAAFDYTSLDRWHRLVMYQLDIVPASTSIDVRRNRISIGVASEAHLHQVERVLDALGIPDAAVNASVVAAPQLAGGTMQSLSFLTDKHRPVPGGVRIESCTIGPNVRWHADPDSVQATFLVPSHCTVNPYDHHWSEPPGTEFHQPAKTNFIGKEVWDPEVWTSGCSNPHGCRNSDAALAIYQHQANSEFGMIARPGARNPSSGYEIIDTQDPRFEIVEREGWTFQGETLEKVGWKTGWSGGQVWDGCEHVAPLDPDTHQPTGPTIYCSMRVQGLAVGGDSGAPIFRVLGSDPESGLEVELRGMLRGNVFCDGQSLPVCFLGSNLEGIELDLDPNWQSGLFQYWPGGPIW